VSTHKGTRHHRRGARWRRSERSMAEQRKREQLQREIETLSRPLDGCPPLPPEQREQIDAGIRLVRHPQEGGRIHFYSGFDMIEVSDE
jgi:hypothetical protein